MAGKKWCQYCRINLPYNKKDIQQHEESRLHLQNKQKSIKFERIKIQREQKQKRQTNKQNALLSTANIPKAKKGSELEKQVQTYKDQVVNSGKAAIHQLIAERTKGVYGAPIQFPEKQDLVLAENFIVKQEGQQSGDQSEEYEMWRIDICQQTGDPCFINAITKAKYYEPPKGHIMSDKQKQQWEYLKDICKQKIDVNEDNVVKISEWQQVPDQDNYFEVNRIEVPIIQQQNQEDKQGVKRYYDSSIDGYLKIKRQEESGPVETKRSWLQDLQQKVNNNQIDANQVMETVIYNKLRLCKNLKEKNQTLKKLINNDIQIRQNPIEGQMHKDLFQDKVQTVGFKSKKKVKTVKLTDDNQIY